MSSDAPSPRLQLLPVSLREANDFVEQFHRHSARTSNDGGKFAIALEHDGQLVGVAIVGRPVSRMLQHGKEEFPAECLRLCTSPECPKGGGSKLYARARRIWQLMGGSHFHTYTLASESGATMRGAGLTEPVTAVPAAKWDRPSRTRVARPAEQLAKVRWTEALETVAP